MKTRALRGVIDTSVPGCRVSVLAVSVGTSTCSSASEPCGRQATLVIAPLRVTRSTLAGRLLVGREAPFVPAAVMSSSCGRK